MPIMNRQDAEEVDQYIRRFFDASGAGRAPALRRLFVEKLDFASATGAVSLAKSPKNVALPSTAERIASMEGLHVVYVQLPENAGAQRVRKAEAAAAAKLISDELHGDLLLVMTNPSCSQLHVIWPTFTTTSPSLRRIIVERDPPRRTAVQQLSNIYWHWKDSGSIRMAVDRAFDVEAVTKEFFKQYKSVFESVMAAVTGFGDGEGEAEAKKLFVQTLFNRLMFIYFISRKGWLAFDGDKDYLDALWRAHRERADGNKNFYTDRLRLLFFAGLNNPKSQDLTSEPETRRLIGTVPFLNGGLFDRTDEDNRTRGVVPDDCLHEILSKLFDRFNFTVMESTPFDQEVAVDPEMLGKVFEELVTGRHESGSYYTPRPVVAFMCREALKGYLETQNTGASTEAIAAFVDHKDTSMLTLSSAPKVGEALARVKVVDPACGSGAYLLGMMQELVELMATLYSAQLSHEAQDLYNLKLRIIEQNLYGADIDQFAVNIAMLRLWLSLAIEYDRYPPLPLPNLDFKIVKGDSLLGPDPSPENYGTLFRHRVHQLAGQFAALKTRHMREPGPHKEGFSNDIKAIKMQLREALADSAAPEGVVDWRVEFAEVFDQNGGFDVVIANPPYVVINSAILRGLYQKGIFGRMNTYGLFIHRGLQLTHDGSQLVYINPRTLLTDKYFTNLRKVLLAETWLREVVLIEDRHHTFARVLQACIILFLSRTTQPSKQYNVQTRSVSVPAVLNEMRAATAIPSTRVCLGSEYDHAFLISDKPALYSVFERMAAHNSTLGRIGLCAQTGPIQFDKFSDYSMDVRAAGSYRLIWAENIQRFAFRSSRKRSSKEWLSGEIRVAVRPNISSSGILTQRVTANEQPRRIIATHIGSSSIEAAGLYSENHTNFIDCSSASVEVAAYALAVLNSTAMDAVFRSLNSNTQVSAGELNYLPFPRLPEKAILSRLAKLVYDLISLGGIDASDSVRRRAYALECEIDEMVNSLYGFTDEEERAIREVTVPLESIYVARREDAS